MPRPDVSAARTQQIISAAIIVFARLGLSNTRMEDIAQEAELSKGTLYLYFESKDALIAAILTSLMSRELEQARQLLSQDLSTYEKLELVVETFLEDVVQLTPFLSLYFEYLSLATREESIRSAIREPYHGLLEVFSALVEQGKASGELRPVDAHEVAVAVGAIMEGTTLLWVYAPDELDLAQSIRASLGLLFTGLFPADPTRFPENSNFQETADDVILKRGER